jgi:hypothetical protein
MTKEFRNGNDECLPGRRRSLFVIRSFGFDSSFGFRHSDFFARNQGQKVDSKGLMR